MKKLFYIIPAFLLSSCFFTVGDLPPDFCDISQSYAQINGSQEGTRCGDATIEYNFNNSTQNYQLILRTRNMVPSDNGSSQDVDLVLTLRDTRPITAGNYMIDPSRGYGYSFSWYDYYISNVETEIVSLNISSDSTVNALIIFTASLDQINYSENARFEYVFRNIKLPSEITQTN